ncbi:hypothetical protein WD019_03785 [Fictibacillus sp. Mic-4]|uniref:hypothetical protein n=1 Tax=Fictibacillus sp. Mic-4 TaxID=3132826 RepID=UPI003CF29B65
MAQLVKLEDYVSRYELDLYRYQGQFIRLKKKRLQQLENKNEKTIEQFKNQLYHFQLNWASSTVREISKVDPRYAHNRLLKWLTTELPDNYFLFFNPVFLVKNAPVQLDIIVVGPRLIWMIVFLEGNDAIFQEQSKRFWVKLDKDRKLKIVNPHLSLQRMHYCTNEWIAAFKEQLRVKKAIVAKDGFIDKPSGWEGTEYVDKRTFFDWLVSVKKEPSPIKSHQLKLVDRMLKHCVTNALLRPEWLE